MFCLVTLGIQPWLAGKSNMDMNIGRSSRDCGISYVDMCDCQICRHVPSSYQHVCFLYPQFCQGASSAFHYVIPQIRPHFAGSEVQIPVVSVGQRSRFLETNRDWTVESRNLAGGTSIDLQRSRQGGTLPPSWLMGMGIGSIGMHRIYVSHNVWQDTMENWDSTKKVWHQLFNNV